MAVRDPERRVAPRSALRYQPVNSGQAALSGPGAVRSRRVPTASRASVARVVSDDLDLEEDEEYIPSRRRSVAPASRQRPAPAPARRRTHPLFLMGVGLLLALCLWVGASWVITWGTNEMNTIVYGYPRTFQLDAVLGHNDSATHPSHLTAMNLHGQILIIEIPGDDPTRSRIYIGPRLLGANSDLLPVTIHLLDPGHTGKPDLLIAAGDLQSVLINTGSGFRSPTPDEQQQLLHL